MKTYEVVIPIEGYLVERVRALCEGDAKELAIENADINNLEEWKIHENIIGGNVCHKTFWELEVIEI